MKRFAVLSVVLLFSLVAAAYTRGGWAVVTIKSPPDYLIVGKPNELTFEIRQHGRTPVSGFRTAIEARNGAKRVAGRTWETATTGVYRASIDIPSAGEWRVTINTDFGKSRAQTLPWRAIRSGEPVPALSDAERGRQLFAAGGCVSCHVHSAVDIDGEAKSMGPDLSQPRLAASYVAQFLANPAIKPPTRNGIQMPNLGLTAKEITALAAFLTNGEVAQR